MDTIDRKVFSIDDVTMAEEIAEVNNEAFNISDENKVTPYFYEDIIMGDKGCARIYGINNIYNNLIGFAYYKLTYRAATLDTLAVMSRYQGMHVGKFLLRESIFDLASKNDIRVVQADVLSSYPILSFYQNCGFTNWDGSSIDTERANGYLTKLSILTK